jgi:hypothetical protein
MSNVHRLPPAPKLKRHGVIRCEIDDAIGVRELGEALASRGLCMTRASGALRIERMNIKRNDR